MKGKRLDVYELEQMKIGSKVLAELGGWIRSLRTAKDDGLVCLIDLDGAVKLRHSDLLRVDVYEYIEDTRAVKNNKPELRVIREFNIAKRKEQKVKKKTREQRLQYIIAHVEMNIDRALENRNEKRFMMLTNKLIEFKQAVNIV